MNDKFIRTLQQLEHEYETVTKVPEDDKRLQMLRNYSKVNSSYQRMSDELLDIEPLELNSWDDKMIKVCKMIKAGKSYKEIGEAVGEKIGSIGNYISNNKLNLNYYIATDGKHTWKSRSRIGLMRLIRKSGKHVTPNTLQNYHCNKVYEARKLMYDGKIIND